MSPVNWLRRMLHPLAPRLSVPPSRGEQHHSTRVLATARVILAVLSLTAIYLDPTSPSRFAALAYVLMIVYCIHSLSILILSRTVADSPKSLRVALHSIDLLWAAAITFFTEGPNSPFYLFFLFVLLAAAYRWGAAETLLTALVAVALLLSQGLLFAMRPEFLRQVVGEGFDLHRLIMRSAYLVLMGILLAYLAEAEKQLRAESQISSRMLQRIQGQRGMRAAAQAVLEELLQIFRAPAALVVTRENPSGRVFAWHARRLPDTAQTTLDHFEVDPSQQDAYWFAVPVRCWRITRPQSPGAPSPAVSAADGSSAVGVLPTLPRSFLELHSFQTMLGLPLAFSDDWAGRLFIFDAAAGTDGTQAEDLLHRLCEQLMPAIYNHFLIRRLRSRAGAIERARVARELHDGLIQSLISLELQLNVLRNQLAEESPHVAAEVGQMEAIVHRQVLDVRQLMQQMRPIDVGPRHFIDFLSELVEKFRRDSGINARFVTDLDVVPLSPHTCQELARIVQEALINARKHSGARNVLVRFAARDGCWLLEIDDDGRGFDFTGKMDRLELDAARKGPIVIKERVRAIGGEIAIESIPGRGSRLEIAVPHTPHG